MRTRPDNPAVFHDDLEVMFFQSVFRIVAVELELHLVDHFPFDQSLVKVRRRGIDLLDHHTRNMYGVRIRFRFPRIEGIRKLLVVPAYVTPVLVVHIGALALEDLAVDGDLHVDCLLTHGKPPCLDRKDEQADASLLLIELTNERQREEGALL